MKRLMLVGQVGSGKTTLTQALHDVEIQYLKTQAVEYSKDVIDTPGEFMERRWQYAALAVTAVEADVIGIVMNPLVPIPAIPASFTSMLNRPVIGIITRMDLNPTGVYLQEAERYVKEAQAEKVFKISAITGEGIAELKSYLQEEV